MIELPAAVLADGGPSKETYVLIVGVLALIGVIATALIKRGSDHRQLTFEKHKLSSEQRKDAKEDIEKAFEAMGAVVIKDADIEARREEATKARVSLQAVAVTHRHLMDDEQFKELQQALANPSEETLTTAARLWPNVEQTILTKWPETPE